MWVLEGTRDFSEISLLFVLIVGSIFLFASLYLRNLGNESEKDKNSGAE